MAGGMIGPNGDNVHALVGEEFQSKPDLVIILHPPTVELFVLVNELVIRLATLIHVLKMSQASERLNVPRKIRDQLRDNFILGFHIWTHGNHVNFIAQIRMTHSFKLSRRSRMELLVILEQMICAFQEFAR
jgi:hypothetical protein